MMTWTEEHETVQKNRPCERAGVTRPPLNVLFTTPMVNPAVSGARRMWPGTICLASGRWPDVAWNHLPTICRTICLVWCGALTNYLIFPKLARYAIFPVVLPTHASRFLAWPGTV